ncbi:hypothetical protein [Candidatus Mycoplasma haematominutum]|uniref:Uncharacterized protein n=1 Tax=Candidatus Mycoplasma haematominutum 'Birmingham 1' TaxID=1116213 RepID=G8C2N2_9MOLU|nr:hypothetical protein [Candidatus Mycoplasma haematominutum]CCE66580.1 hypothetical protein MHM_00620 [Candidatus Mycoplasma haematominutum 'Birmingham 1']
MSLSDACFALTGYFGLLIILFLTWVHCFKKLGVQWFYNTKPISEIVKLQEYKEWKANTRDWCQAATNLRKKLFGESKKSKASKSKKG